MTALRVGFLGDSYRKRSFTRRYQHFFRNPKLAGGLLPCSAVQRTALNGTNLLCIDILNTNAHANLVGSISITTELQLWPQKKTWRSRGKLSGSLSMHTSKYRENLAFLWVVRPLGSPLGSYRIKCNLDGRFLVSGVVRRLQVPVKRTLVSRN